MSVKANNLKSNLLEMDADINTTRFNHLIVSRLTQVLLKNYIKDEIPNDNEHLLIFAAQHDDIAALVYAIDEFARINTAVYDKVSSELEMLNKAVKSCE